MKLKVVALVLFILTAFSGSLAQANPEKAYCQVRGYLLNSGLGNFDADNWPDPENRSGEAVLPKETAGQASQKNLLIHYKGIQIAPLPEAPSKEMPFLLPAADAGAAGKPKTGGQGVERLTDGVDWDAMIRQSLLFLGVQHSLRLMQAKTIKEMKGPFFEDYVASLKGIKGWGDGDGLVTNYLGHPAMGAVSGYLQIHNDPKGRRLELSRSKAYWKSRLKSFAWSAAYSTQFEIGLLGEATIGNVGKRAGTGGYVDFVITPTLGTLVIVLEDAADKYIVNPLERRTQNFHMVRLARTFMNPMRSLANLLRFKKPWYRDRAVDLLPGGNALKGSEENLQVK